MKRCNNNFTDSACNHGMSSGFCIGAAVMASKTRIETKTGSSQRNLYRMSIRINSTILANTLKNKRKAEKKKRALERRMSESDAVNLQTEQQPVTLHSNMSGSSSLDLSMLRKDWKEEELADSGLASSFEENLVITDSQGEVKTKTKKMTKKRSKQFVMSNELIFDLDI